jgi:hypothetical protein
MLACAFLPFLPLIVDAQIRQLGHDNSAKREAAMQFLEKVMRTSRGRESYSVLKKVGDALKAEGITPRSDGPITIRSGETVTIRSGAHSDKLVRLNKLYQRNKALRVLEWVKI